MSRNKAILLIICLVVILWALPTDGLAGTIRYNALALLPYLFGALIVYLLITINLLRRSLYRLHENPTTENTLDMAKKMKITFDVKRMLGADNLIQVYKEANFSKKIDIEAKQALYDAMKQKRLDVPPPSKGKS